MIKWSGLVLAFTLPLLGVATGCDRYSTDSCEYEIAQIHGFSCFDPNFLNAEEQPIKVVLRSSVQYEGYCAESEDERREEKNLTVSHYIVTCRVSDGEGDEFPFENGFYASGMTDVCSLEIENTDYRYEMQLQQGSSTASIRLFHGIDATLIKALEIGCEPTYDSIVQYH